MDHTVHRVAKSWTQLGDSYFHIYPSADEWINKMWHVCTPRNVIQPQKE